MGLFILVIFPIGGLLDLELEALVILTTIPFLGSIKIRQLISHFGSATKALNASKDAINQLPGFGPKIQEAWDRTLHAEGWKKELAYAKDKGIHVIPFTHPDYPQRLLDISDYPLVIYKHGTLIKADHRCIAIVGTRNASLYGMEMAKKLARDLAQAGFTIISGLARGIDTAAHEGALQGGRTVAVLGSGLSQIYPLENRGLADAIAQQGVVLSEFPLFTPPERTLFPQRNRIISGMSLGTVLVEAPLKSGSMLTMTRALKQGRRLFALPGRADLDNFRGNHALIKEGKANLIEDAQDIIKEFEDPCHPLPRSSSPSKEIAFLDKDEEALVQKLSSEEQTIEEILYKTQLPVHKLHILLMSLVLKSVIKEYPGKIYKKLI